jgi:inhibitor of cysteine peptidase
VRVYTEQDDGASIALAAGDSLQIRLAENPTTGYRWQLEAWEQTVLVVTRDEFVPPGPARHGTGGEHLWEFVARAAGRASLRLTYRRVWSSAPPTRSFSLSLLVA